MANSLIHKYNVAGPRYTSYPTVPYWNVTEFSIEKWHSSLAEALEQSNKSEGISLYIHLPFCESLCTFCGCHKRITKQHNVEKTYIDTVLEEWRIYQKILDCQLNVKEIHLGGGTPTFFSPENLQRLINGILANSTLARNYELSFEGHPNNTTPQHLETLYQLGFRRVSFGIQDYNEVVQKAIHRIQPFEKVESVTEVARKIGYNSIGHDIIFGLPFQSKIHIKETIEKTKLLRPDRVAFYSYAHVPWIKGNGQRGFDENDLPTAEQKRQQYELGKKLLDEAGYIEIGMDHFSLPTDALYTASSQGKLHRNFMGYTASKTQVMIGIGVSSISDSWYGFAQNTKNLGEYYQLLKKDSLPIFRGHILSKEDLIIRKHILNLMCLFRTSWEDKNNSFEELPNVLARLKEVEDDGLINILKNEIVVTEAGKAFIRNICMAFDLLLQRNKPESQLFSMTI